MLVLRRSRDQDIFLYVPGLDEPIVVRFVKRCGDHPETQDVKIGIEAPEEVQIVREEIAHLYNPETGEKL